MNLANRLTISRIVMSLFIMVFLLIPWNEFNINFPTFLAGGKVLVDVRYLIVGLVFIIASITDYFDGRIARSKNMCSDFGACLDAIADKILVNGLLIILAYQGFISEVIPVIIITRDVIVDALKTLSASKGTVVKANIWGKIKTACMMIGLVLVLFYNMPFELWNIKLDYIFVYLATVLSVVSGIIYYFQIKKE